MNLFSGPEGVRYTEVLTVYSIIYTYRGVCSIARDRELKTDIHVRHHESLAVDAVSFGTWEMTSSVIYPFQVWQRDLESRAV